MRWENERNCEYAGILLFHRVYSCRVYCDVYESQKSYGMEEISDTFYIFCRPYLLHVDDGRRAAGAVPAGDDSVDHTDHALSVCEL